ncbi:MAG: nucleoside deaminase [Balneolaceae bacterium]|nr:nucleoside deaminase [Balneolaceae bacterium]
MINPAEQNMRAAIEAAEELQTPFGAALAMGEELFATAACRINDLANPEKHAAFMGIRELNERLRKKNLSGFILYTTCEPSRESIKEAEGANISTIFFGCSHSEVSRYVSAEYYKPEDLNFDDSTVEMIGGILNLECIQLLDRFTDEDS